MVYTPHTKPVEFALHHLNNTTVKKLHLVNMLTLYDEHISGLQLLKELTICDNEGITYQGVLGVVEQCPQLKALRINRYVRMDSDIVLKVLHTSPTLRRFHFLSKYKEQWPREVVYEVLHNVVRHSFPHVYDFKLN